MLPQILADFFPDKPWVWVLALVILLAIAGGLLIYMRYIRIRKM
jgi:hypothetical protein